MGRGPSIEGRKNAEDAKRSKVFTKLIREITVAARTGGGDTAANPRLRVAVDKALAANMTKDTIERGIRKATGELEGVAYEEVRYEGYAPGGVAVIVECVTDNRQRAVADVRHAFTKFGGNLGTEGSVGYLFRKVGVLSFGREAGEEQITDAAIEAGADDVVSAGQGDAIEVLASPEQFEAVRQAMQAAGLQPARAEVTLRAETTISLRGEQAQSVARLLEWLQDLDDVQEVYCNADLPPDAHE